MENKVTVSNKTKLLAAAAAAVLAISSGCGTTGGTAADETSSASESTESKETSNWYFINTPDVMSPSSALKENERRALDSGSLTAVSAVWARDTDADNYTEYKVDDTEFNSDVMITANENVKNFRVVSVSFTINDRDDEPYYVTENKTLCGDLAKGQSVKLSLAFPGDLPTNGIAFTDESGSERFYVLQESGKDGSLISFEVE